MNHDYADAVGMMLMCLVAAFILMMPVAIVYEVFFAEPVHVTNCRAEGGYYDDELNRCIFYYRTAP